MSLESGMRLGPYQIEGPAGAGGMGEVYRATDTRLDRAVAIKVLPAHLANHPELKQRLEREAKTISSLQHPNICALYDIGHESDVDFLVMEYLEGETLAERLRGGALATEQVLSIGVQITEALDAAHRKGVIHRDLKPGNIMLTKAGVKLLDFGLAKSAEGAVSTDSSTFTQLATQQKSRDPLTEEGTVLGTFQYMSPEQLEGQEADARSDIFGLGTVLYEMATGKKAFEGKSQASLIAAIMSSQPAPITTIQPMTPPALERVIRTCLEKDPDGRWQTAHDVALQLKWIQEGGSQAGIPRPVASRRRSRERLAWTVAAGSVVAAVTLAALHFTGPAPEPTSSIRFQIDAPHAVVSFGSPRISPDGKFIAFDGTDTTGTRMMWLRPLNSLAAHPLPGSEGCNRPFWSPDSRYVAFFAAGKLKRIPITGGPPLTLCESSNGSDGSWSSQGVILFDGRTGDSLQVVSAGGGTPAGATTLDRSRGENMHGWPFFLPDGKHFMFIAFRTGNPSEIHIGELGTMKTQVLTEADSRIEYVPPGYLVFERNGTLLVQHFDAGARKLTGDPFPLTEGIGVGDVGLAHFSGSRTGTLIFTGGDPVERQFVWFGRDGHELGTVGQIGRLGNPALSPSGKRLAFEQTDERNEKRDIWVLDLARNVQSRFTFDPENDGGPSWSPDGSKIVFSSARGGDWDVFIKDASGTGNAQLLYNAPVSAAVTDWTRDGKSIVLQSIAPGNSWNIGTLSPGDSTVTPQVATTFVEVQGHVSPDGRFLAYTSNESGRFEIYVTSFPAGGGKWQVSLDGGTEPTWRGDGRELYYLALDRRLMAVDMLPGTPIEIGVPHRLFAAPVPRSIVALNRYLPAPDGKKFLLVTLLDRGAVSPTTVILNWAAELETR